ncbi:MAG: sensor histidine kinase [Phycisphaerae bacterium]
MTWRRVGLLLVLLAVTLAMGGLVVAHRHANALIARLIIHPLPRARQIAATATRRCADAVLQVFRGVARGMSESSAVAASADAAMPKWIDGVYVYDGARLVAVRPPSRTADALRAVLAARVTTGTFDAADPDRFDHVEMLYGDIDGKPVVLPCVLTRRTDGAPVWVLGRIRLDLLREILVEPLISPADGLELVPRGETSAAWSQPMYAAMQHWQLQPTAAYEHEQRRIVLWQMLLYTGLTALSLLTLLAAMWFLARVVRRELALSAMKSSFVADVSHELKTPLALIRLFGETLHSGRVTSPDKQREYYAIITRESTRLTNLINNILDFSKIDAGRKEYTFAPVDVSEVVRETYEAYRYELDDKGFEHCLRLNNKTRHIMADRDAIAQALVNLVSNALKYAGEERFLEIELTDDTRRGQDGVLIAVRDRGIGIRPEDRAHVFDGFYRAADQQVRRKRGAGLGLSLVKHIADAHSGAVDVESRLVKGSTFRIFLPKEPPGIEETGTVLY